MKVGSAKSRPKWWVGPAAWIVRAMVAGLGGSCSVHYIRGREHLDALERDRRPVIFVFWHHQLFLATYLLHRDVVRRGVSVAPLISLSRDGDFGARLGRIMGTRVIRGSSSHGGASALRQLRREVEYKQSSVVMIPDGSRGPPRLFRPGTIALAQITGAPVVSIAIAVDRYWRLRSWDRSIIPRPFARLNAIVDDPVTFSSKLSSNERRGASDRLADILNTIESDAIGGLH